MPYDDFHSFRNIVAPDPLVAKAKVHQTRQVVSSETDDTVGVAYADDYELVRYACMIHGKLRANAMLREMKRKMKRG